MGPLLDVSKKIQQPHWIEINTAHLRHNAEALRSLQIPGTRVMGIVKADAYGHGIRSVVPALAPHVDFFGVSAFHEALAIREMGLSHPVLIFPKLFGAELAEAVRAGFSFSVSSEDEIEEIAEIARGMARPARLHVKIDTGMGRFGIPHHEAVRRISHVFDTEGVEFEGIFTHFPVAEREDGFTENQVARFATVLQGLEKKGIFFRYRHGCNSAGCVKVRTPVFNMIRPGLMLYGVYPDLALRDLALIKPVLSLKTRILFVKKMLPGETAGYGRLYAPQRPVQLAVLGFGYSHGYPCQAFPKAQVLYKGHRLPLAGRISMDYATVELGSLDARVGDEVTLIGSENGSSLGAEEIAGWAGTIPYHIFTGLNARIPRFTEGHANG